jgi:MFS transporter, DHA2 family, multidrug resistance protein
VAGLASAETIAGKLGAKLAVAAGFTVLAAGLGLGAATTAASGEAFAATWMAIAGVGAGLTMATATTAALAELSADRAGVGSGVQQALRNVGAPLGSAVLGSALTSAYVSHLRLAGLSPAAAHAARPSVFGGVAVARALKSAPLLASVRAAFVHGMDVALLVSLGFAAAGIVLALIFMPARAGRQPDLQAAPRPETSPSWPASSSTSAGRPVADATPPKT